MPIIKKEGYPYAFNSDACAACQGRCCTGESGYIYVTKAEIFTIAELLNMDVNEFGVKYLFKHGYKYSLKENSKIYMARPNQCKTFPFWDYYKTRVDELKLECPGIIDD